MIKCTHQLNRLPISNRTKKHWDHVLLFVFLKVEIVRQKFYCLFIHNRLKLIIYMLSSEKQVDFVAAVANETVRICLFVDPIVGSVNNKIIFLVLDAGFIENNFWIASFSCIQKRVRILNLMWKTVMKVNAVS